MRQLRGNVRYRFRSDDHDVNIVIEGDAEWVANHVDELGSDRGRLDHANGNRGQGQQPLQRESRTTGGRREHRDGGCAGIQAPADMGPTPDPSRIPIVRRPIGELNLQEKLSQAGLEPAERPDIIELMDILEDMDPPTPVQGATSVDPMAEAWLRELLQLVVRDHGSTGLRTEDIEEIASSKLGGREGTALEVWLESLFSAGKLVKIHGGDATGWGPSPKWLSGRI